MNVIEEEKAKCESEQVDSVEAELVRELLVNIMRGYNRQRRYIETNDIAGLNYLKREDIIDEIIGDMESENGKRIGRGRVSKILKDMQSLMLDGKSYPLYLLIPGKDFPYIQAEDIIRMLCAEHGCSPRDLIAGKNPLLRAIFITQLNKRSWDYHRAEGLPFEVDDKSADGYVKKFIKKDRKERVSSSLTKQNADREFGWIRLIGRSI